MPKSAGWRLRACPNPRLWWIGASGPAATAITNFGVSAEEQFDPVPASGELVITRCDTEALEGTLNFDGVESFAEDEPREITVKVEFTVTCSPQFHSICQ